MRGLKTVKGWLIDIFAMEASLGMIPASDPTTGVITQVREPFPCGVRTCFAKQIVLSHDEESTVVECPEHGCVTTWESIERKLGVQNIIRPQDGWHQHGISGPPKR